MTTHIAELGTVRAPTKRHLLREVHELVREARDNRGDVTQVLIFRQGTEWLATVTVYPGGMAQP